MSNVNLEQIKRSEFSDLPKFEKQDVAKVLDEVVKIVDHMLSLIHI